MRRRLGGRRRVVLYTQAGCHLCEEVAALLDAWGVAYETAWDERYALRIPVVEIDGRIVAEAPIDPRALRNAVKNRR